MTRTPNRATERATDSVKFVTQAFDAGYVDPGIAAASAQNVCVWSNTATRGYNITASGSGAGNAFTLANAALTIPYAVEWSDTSGAASGTALTSGTAL